MLTAMKYIGGACDVKGTNISTINAYPHTHTCTLPIMNTEELSR